VAKFITKAILNTDESSNLGIDWATSKRTILKVNDEIITIAGSKINFSEIIDSKLRIVPSAFFIPGAILTIKTYDSTHHFGFSYSKKIINTFTFIKNIEKSNPPWLWIRRTINIAVLSYLIYYFFK
jgi:hypothetical protein